MILIANYFSLQILKKYKKGESDTGSSQLLRAFFFFQEPLLILHHHFTISEFRWTGVFFLHRVQCYSLTKILEAVVYRKKCREKGWLYRSS